MADEEIRDAGLADQIISALSKEGVPLDPEPDSQEPDPIVPETPVPEETTESAESPTDASLLSRIKDRFGADLSSKYKDDDQALQGLVNAYHLVGRRDALAEYGERFRQYEPEFAEFLRSKQEPSPQQTQPVPGQEAPPPYDPSWHDQVEMDEQGRVVAKAGAEPGVVGKLQKYTTWARENQRRILENELLRDPERLREEMRTVASEAAQEQVRQAVAFVEEKTKADNFIWESRPWMFQDGDQKKGLSPTGHRFRELVNYVYQSGVTDMDRQIELATAMLRNERVAAQQRQSSKPSPQATRQAMHKPNTAPQDVRDTLVRDGESVEQALARNLRAAGLWK